ncbi:MAG: hypothetical protein ACKOCC_05515 [Actinomycetota bacterium]
MSGSELASWVDILSGLVTSLSLPFAIYTYLKRKRIDADSAQKLADDDAYEQLFDDYNDFLKLVIQHPQVNLADEPLTDNELQSTEKDDFLRIKALSLFNIFLSIAERAFLLYRNASDTARVEQWEGWQTYIVEVLSRPDIRKMYNSHKLTYDKSFVAAVETWLDQTDCNGAQ